MAEESRSGRAGVSTEPPDDRSGTGAPELRPGDGPPVLGAVEVADVRSGVGTVTAAELPLLFRILDRIVNVFLGLGFVLLLTVIGLNVFGRMLFGGGLPWADEAARFLFIWVAFLGGAVAYYRREHISVGFLVAKLPPRLHLAMRILQELLVLLVLAFLMYGAFVLIDVTFRRSALLGIPMSYVFAAVPVSAFLMALMAMYRIGRLARGRED
jgi:TRAP-type transport system small permease protein